jgi:polar amino acid transport system substrate-binding protein
MNPNRCRPHRSRVTTVIAALLIAGLGACGEKEGTGQPSGGGASTEVAADAALAGQVPAEVKSDGKIVIGVDASYAPNEFLDTDGKTVVGFDVDLFDAVAEKLGLATEWMPAPFDAIITGVQSGKYEVGVSSFTINDTRKKQAEMVSYFSAGTQWATKKGNPSGIQPDDACGKRVAVQKATVQVDDITARSEACTGAGKQAITIDQYQAQSDATTAVVSGKDDAMLADSPVCAYAVSKTNGQLELLGDIYDSAPYGYVVPKGQTPFAEALRGALAALIADGTYNQVLTGWAVEAGAITTPAVNP